MIINRSVDFSRRDIIPSQVVAIKIFFQLHVGCSYEFSCCTMIITGDFLIVHEFQLRLYRLHVGCNYEIFSCIIVAIEDRKDFSSCI
jgi:hypothetical protein